MPLSHPGRLSSPTSAVPIAVGFVAAVMASVAAPRAATLHVPSVYPTIQAGLDAAAAGDTVLVAAGTYSEAETRGNITASAFLTDGVALVSQTGPAATVIAAPGTYAVHGSGLVTAGTVLSGFTIESALLGVTLGGTTEVLIEDCVFEDFAATAIRSDRASLVLRGCTFSRCRGGVLGAVFVLGSQSLTIEGCDFVDNTGRSVFFLGWIHSDAAVAVSGSGFLRNAATSGQSVVSLQSTENVTVVDCDLIANTGAGALRIQGDLGAINQMMVERNVFSGNRTASSEEAVSALIAVGHTGTVRENTFWANEVQSAQHSCAGFVSSPASVVVERNVFSDSVVGSAIADYGSGAVVSNCNVFWSNEGGDWPADQYMPGPDEVFADPLFCAPGVGDFSVATGSPCLPGGNTCGMQLGAQGLGCDTVGLESLSWGRLKSNYREGR